MDVNKMDRITVVTLTDICKQHFHLSRKECNSKTGIHAAIFRQPIPVQQKIDLDITKAIENGLTKHRKRTQDLEENLRTRKRQRLSGDTEIQNASTSTIPLSPPQIQQSDTYEDFLHNSVSNHEEIDL